MTWDPPWPPVRISDCEWVIVRDDRRNPAAVVRRFEFGPDRETWFRIVTWAQASADRRLIGWCRTLEAADRHIRFTPGKAGPGMHGPNTHGLSAAAWAERAANPRNRGGSASDNRG